jgi:hypothetical protein
MGAGDHFAELRQPVNWAYMATALQKAASLMDWATKRDITDWRYIPIYRMLMGVSLENLIKGILVAEDHPCMADGARLHHGLAEYANLIKGVALTETDRNVLADLEHYVLWAGRYPRPQQAKGMIAIGHSQVRHDAELRLGQRLYDYLRSLCPEIEPDMFLLPRIVPDR